jgi:hypothetical protein
MSSYGFVYILGNEYMPDLYKIGCTERSPHARAAELSQATGVPAQFRVLCYAEFDKFQSIEKNMHQWCSGHRVNNGREFFQGCLRYAVQLLWWHPHRLSFTDATIDPKWGALSELFEMVRVGEPGISGFDDLRNPFGKAEEENARQAERLRIKAEIDAFVDEATEPIAQPPDADDDFWHYTVRQLIDGELIHALARELALKSQLIGRSETLWTLRTESEFLNQVNLKIKLSQALASIGYTVPLEVETGAISECPADRTVGATNAYEVPK